VARELWEEAALTAVSIGPLVGSPQRFTSRKGKEVCKFNFLVGTESATSGKEGKGMDVKLDPKEHQNFVWASEEEVKAGKVGELEIEFTMKDLEATVLEAFAIKDGNRGTLSGS